MAAVVAAAGLAGCGGDDETGSGGAGEERSAGSNGPEIAFDHNLDVWAMNADGSERTQLTDSPRAQDSRPTWSPDGERIVFTRFGGAASSIWVMNDDGSEQAKLADTPRGGGATAPAWSPDGKRIAFSRQADREFAIWVMNADGSDAEQLITGGETEWHPEEGTLVAGRIPGSPSFSPDGKRIAFSVLESGPRARKAGGIHVMNDDGSGVRQLTDDPEDGDPTWAPDGERIVFTRSRPRERGIYVVNADGTGQTRLMSPQREGVVAYGATLSPGGERIAFLGLGTRVDGRQRRFTRVGRRPRLWIMNADGSGPRQLLDRPSSPLMPPVFSPDGQRILFVVWPNSANRPEGLIVVNADGSNPVPVPGTRGFEGFASWSPSGAAAAR